MTSFDDGGGRLPEGDEVEQLMRGVAVGRPDAAALRRVRARVDQRIARRRLVIFRSIAFGLPFAGAVAIAWPALRSARFGPSASMAELLSPALPTPQAASPPVPSPTPAAPPALAAASPRSGTKHRPRSGASSVIARRPGPDAPAALISPPDSMGAETERLSSAISLLRTQGDPASALRTLDDYRRSYPAAHFASEARLLRIEALIALGQRCAALGELSPAEIPSLPRREELWVMRGEILLELGNPAEALDAFDAALSSAKVSGLVERALAGRAAARRDLPAR